MNFDWYKVINKTAFEATGLVSRKITMLLQGAGAKDILVTRGNLTAITVDDVFLPVGITDANPFIFQERACYIDDAGDIWYGIQNDAD
jgi:hypothetical protein